MKKRKRLNTKEEGKVALMKQTGPLKRTTDVIGFSHRDEERNIGSIKGQGKGLEERRPITD